MNGQPATEVIGTALDAGCGRRLKPPAARRRWLLAVVLALFTLPLADGGALAQCARCGQTNMGATIAAPAPVVAAPRRTVVAHLWSGSDTQTSHHGAARPASSGGGSAVAICVRTCDGSFFPASYASEASRAKSLADVCRSLCPNAEVAPYSFPFGGTIDQAVSTTGEPYNRLPNAHKFEQAFELELLMPRAGAKLGRSARRRRGQIPAPFEGHPRHRCGGGADVAARRGGKAGAGDCR